MRALIALSLWLPLSVSAADCDRHFDELLTAAEKLESENMSPGMRQGLEDELAEKRTALIQTHGRQAFENWQAQADHTEAFEEPKAAISGLSVQTVEVPNGMSLLDVSPDGSRYLAKSGDSLFSVSTRGLPHIHLQPGTGSDDFNAKFLNDGNKILVTDTTDHILKLYTRESENVSYGAVRPGKKFKLLSVNSDSWRRDARGFLGTVDGELSYWKADRSVVADLDSPALDLGNINMAKVDPIHGLVYILSDNSKLTRWDPYAEKVRDLDAWLPTPPKGFVGSDKPLHAYGIYFGIYGDRLAIVSQKFNFSTEYQVKEVFLAEQGRAVDFTDKFLHQPLMFHSAANMQFDDDFMVHDGVISSRKESDIRDASNSFISFYTKTSIKRDDLGSYSVIGFDGQPVATINSKISDSELFYKYRFSEDSKVFYGPMNKELTQYHILDIKRLKANPQIEEAIE